MVTEKAQRTLDQVKEYYGKTLESKHDLKTESCCTGGSVPAYVSGVLGLIEPEITERFYGCGSPIPPGLGGCAVVDLGCGTGRDVFIAAKLVGESGEVIGVDMTDEQLNVATRNVSSQMKRFGFSDSNVDFRKGYIEDLSSVGLEDESVDVVISNCVINLSPDKARVFAEVFRVLKPGGEFYFSDIFTNRRVPKALGDDPVLRGECLCGALYTEDFRRMMGRVGCPDVRVTNSSRVDIHESSVAARIGMIDFYSRTIRAFKIADLEDGCEDYGQLATYRGSLSDSLHRFALDEDHVFPTGKPIPVCGNTASMLTQTRYAKHFSVVGDRSMHFGAFRQCEHQDDVSVDGGCC